MQGMEGVSLTWRIETCYFPDITLRIINNGPFCILEEVFFFWRGVKVLQFFNRTIEKVKKNTQVLTPMREECFHLFAQGSLTNTKVPKGTIL